MENHRKTDWLRSSGTLTLLLFTGLGCRPGYLKASDLESSGQGPAACAKSCEELGMRMAALVLVSNSVPGCVCQPVVGPAPAPKADVPAAPDAPKVDAPAPAAPSGPAASDAQSQGAAAATTGFIVLAAAAAAQQAQQEHERRSEQVNY
jgi:hypothetical protein